MVERLPLYLAVRRALRRPREEIAVARPGDDFERAAKVAVHVADARDLRADLAVGEAVVIARLERRALPVRVQRGPSVSVKAVP